MSNLFKSDARKALVGLFALLASALSTGLIPAPWDVVANAILVVAGTYGIYQARNTVRGGDGF